MATWGYVYGGDGDFYLQLQDIPNVIFELLHCIGYVVRPVVTHENQGYSYASALVSNTGETLLREKESHRSFAISVDAFHTFSIKSTDDMISIIRQIYYVSLPPTLEDENQGYSYVSTLVSNTGETLLREKESHRLFDVPDAKPTSPLWSNTVSKRRETILRNVQMVNQKKNPYNTTSSSHPLYTRRDPADIIISTTSKSPHPLTIRREKVFG